MSNKSDTENYIELVKNRLSEKRFRHSIGTAETCRSLAERHGYAEPEKAYLAGLLHDICKELEPAELKRTALIALAEEPAHDPLEAAEKTLLHGPSGALYIRDILDIKDSEIYAAVRFHSTGRAGMSTLEKIVYLGDIVEQNRSYPDVEIYRKYAFDDLDNAMYEVLKWGVINVVSRNLKIAQHSFEAYNYYCGKMKGKSQ
ncbi:MAG: bis(5'-nucleosyl)-tetraphosphatase (symmetrical) YqeK [Oscillospiraceae bacterium]|nr:bis(5'-nucleosyl)-tetraphosphatase (symmetrical) YqeK [Oscillospiraceae bacterium]